MANRLPQLTLLLLLAMAAAVVAGGAILARHTETVRLSRDRTPLRDFATAMEEETRTLERLYESHLRGIAEAANLQQVAVSRPVCEGIIGIVQLSLLRGEGAREPDQHLMIASAARGARWPEPALRKTQGGLPQRITLLPASELLQARAEHTGWIDRPGEPLLYWVRRDPENVAIVFTLDRVAVASAIDEWLRLWLSSGASGAFAGVTATDGPDRILSTRGVVLAAVGIAPQQPDRPDFLLPLRGRFGTWQLASWDHYDRSTSYHLPTLAGAGVLGLFMAVLGVGIFTQQRRASALAAQRVSFVNRVSHELRTPLTNILLNLDLASDSAPAPQPAAARRLELVREESRRLGRLIENVLTFSRHEQGKLRPEPRVCIPSAVIDAAVEQFAPSFARRSLSVVRKSDVVTPLILDPDALAQILANLLSNVEKYVPEGTVMIDSTWAGAELTVSVADHGPGIRMADSERVFLPFERLESRIDEGVSGTGLGLAIARDLAISMGGSLRLLSMDVGATFELRIPAPAARPPHLLCAEAPTTLTA